MYRRERGFRELAGWQCLAGRSILRMKADELARLAATTQLTIKRWETGRGMPRPATVMRIEAVLRRQGVYPTWDKDGEPKGLILGWKGFKRAYPDRPPVKHRFYDIEKELTAPAPNPAIAKLEVEEARLMAELARLRAAAQEEEELTW